MRINWENMDKYLAIPLLYRFVDQAEVDPGYEGWGIKVVSTQDWYFKIHFPGNPIMPGVFLMEMMQQTGLLILSSVPENDLSLLLFHSCEAMRMFREVRPGDILKSHVELLSLQHGIAKFVGEVFSAQAGNGEEKKVCSMKFMLEKRDRLRDLKKADNVYHPKSGAVYIDYKQMSLYIADPLPYRFVDGVHVVPGDCAWGVKNISSQDWFFDSSFSIETKLPVAYLMEALMQTGVFLVTMMNNKKFKLMMFHACKKLCVYRQPEIGDTIHMNVQLLSYRNGIASYKGVALESSFILAEMEFVLVAPEEMILVRK